MTAEPEQVDGEVVDPGPDPELAPAVDEKLPDVQLAVQDPSDSHEVMLRMDDHDVQMLLSEVQSAALRKWIYELPGNKGTGLTVHAVQDIVQRMNWTGKARIGLLKDESGVPVMEVEVLEADEGHGPEPFWVATTYAEDTVSGLVLPGSAMEPQHMRLRNGTTKFDRFARTKAIQKASRNALGAHIPEEIEQTVIAMFAKDPSRVERIQTEAEAKVADLPPALTDERAVAQVAKARALYDEIRNLGGGRGKLDVTPGHFNAYLTAAQHDHDRLEDFIGWLGQRKTELEAKYAEEES